MKDCMTTYTKVQFNTFEPEEDKLCIEDIAHALSMKVRANGHFPEFFSVGQHKFLGYVPEGEEAVLVKNIDDACLYYEFDHFMGEKLFPVEPVMMGNPSYEVQPMKDVEAEFLELYYHIKEQMQG